jgi:hypothetical protein
MALRCYTILFFFFGWMAPVVGQVETPSPRPIPNEVWKKALQRLDYSRDMPLSQRSVQSTSPSNTPRQPDMEGLFDVIKIVLLGLLLLSVGWLAYAQVLAARNRAIGQKEGADDTENVEQHLYDSDLNTLLQRAINAEDFRQATRIHFLMIIKHLSKKGALQWSQEKTNRQYVREMLGRPQVKDFQRAVLLYEYVWYGNRPIGRERYEAEVAPLFEGLLGYPR